MNNVKIKLDGGIMPKRATDGAAAYDLYVPEDYELKQGRQIIPLKVAIEMPQTLCAFVKSRSGFDARGIECEVTDWNGTRTVRIDGEVKLGLIDSDFRDGIGAIL